MRRLINLQPLIVLLLCGRAAGALREHCLLLLAGAGPAAGAVHAPHCHRRLLVLQVAVRRPVASPLLLLLLLLPMLFVGVVVVVGQVSGARGLRVLRRHFPAVVTEKSPPRQECLQIQDSIKGCGTQRAKS